MALRPEDRYAEVPQIVSDVEAYQGGFATSAENAGAWTQFTLLIKRHKVAAIGIAAVLLVGATLGTKAFVEGKRAEKALANLHKAAPSLVAQARALVAELKLDAAVEQLDFALAIDPRNLDYALERANYLQAAQHLREAAEAYRGVLRSGENATASANLALCEKLLAVQGSGALSESALDELRVALVAQHREAEAVPIIAQLGKGKEALLVVLRERLAIWRKLPDWRDDRLSLDWNGNVFLNLGERDKPRIREMPITDLSPLHGLFIENLALGRCPVSDLRPLAGMRLTQFSANNERQLTTLSGLENAPLHGVSIDGSNVADLSALRGCRTLDWITMANTPITDLSPIQNCPLSSLSAANSSIQSLEPLRGMKTLKTITLGNCQAITDVSPLADCPNLRTIELPPRATRIETLRKLPNLYYISFK
ncbi:MAG: hypothetical protein EBS05_22885 [Proteobacteria bacterium]|nr:hypothetical protein [Pseudomonadota bacterium]